MRNLIVKIILLFTAVFGSFSQNAQFDSLKNELNNIKDDKAKTKLLNKIGHLYHALNPQEGLKYARQAIELSQKKDLKLEMANAYLIIGECYYILSDYPKSLENYQISLKIHEENNNDKGIATTSSNIAVIFEAQQNFVKASEYYKKSLSIYEKMNDKSGMALILGNLGILYGSQGKNNQALPYFQKALEMFEKINDPEGIARNTVNIGELYKNENNYNKAIEYYTRALNMSKLISDKRGISIIYLNIGETFSKQNKSKEAIEYFVKSLEAAKELDYKETELISYNDLSKEYSKLGNYKAALDYYEKYVALKDSVFSEENERKISNITANFRAEKQEKENELLRERNKLQMQYFFVILGLVVIILIVLYLRYRVKQKSLKVITEKNIEIEKANQVLENLNTELQETNATKDKFFQIISHELLNPVRWMNNITRMLPQKVKDMSNDELIEVANVLNQTASQSNKLLENLLQWARLHTGRVVFAPEQIQLKEFVQEVISLLDSQIKTKSINLIINIDDAFVVEADKNMLSAIFRNLIENAVKFCHNSGMIEIKAESIENHSVIYIIDNGVGISENDMNKLFRIDVHHSTPGTAKEIGSGFGLILCKEYVEKHEGSISVVSEIGKGSTFRLNIPKK